MRILKKAIAAGALLACLAGSVASAGTMTVVTAPPNGVSTDNSATNTFDPNFPHRHFLLCDIIASAMIETPPGQPLVFGDRHVVSKYTLNDKPVEWFEPSYLDFARAFPKVWQDLQKSGRQWNQDYKFRAASVDVSGDGHKEMLYQIRALDGTPEGRLYVTDDKDNGFVTRIFDALQPVDVISYNGAPYVISRANGAIYVNRLYPSPGAHNANLPNILVAQACAVADPLPPQLPAPAGTPGQ